MATVSRSKRRRRRKQKVPHLVGLHVRDAQLVLRHRGFYDPSLDGTPEEGEPRVEVRYTKNFAPYGTVVAQEPSKGQIVDSDTVVQMTVSMESLLDYMPAIYRRPDVAGGNFVRDFLWIFQSIFHSIESKIDNMWTYFDVFETPSEFLPWLGSWVAFALDGEWDEAERRLFLKRAVGLYRVRGTVRGLKTFLKMYTGVDAEIIENAWPLDGFQIGVASTIGIDSAILPPINRAHCFIVEVPLDPDTLDDDEIIKIHQIINQERPAHTAYYLTFTGAKEGGAGWVGPVIGAYMVGTGTVVRGEEAEKLVEKAGGTTGEAEVSEDERAKRRAERRKKKSEALDDAPEPVQRRRTRRSRSTGEISAEAPVEAAEEVVEEAPAEDPPPEAPPKPKRSSKAKPTAEPEVSEAPAAEASEATESAAEKRARRRRERRASAEVEASGDESAAEKRARRRRERSGQVSADASESAAEKRARRRRERSGAVSEGTSEASESAAERRARRRSERSGAVSGETSAADTSTDTSADTSTEVSGESAAERRARRRRERKAEQSGAVSEPSEATDAPAEEAEPAAEAKPAKKKPAARKSRAKKKPETETSAAEERARARRSRRKKKDDSGSDESS